MTVEEIYRLRNTIASTVKISGIGLHSGRNTHVEIKPLIGDRRGWYLNGTRLVDHDIVSGQLATVLQSGAVRISTVEHLFSALYAHQIHDVDIEVFGEEVPILDGSTAPWFEAITPKPGRGLPTSITPTEVLEFNHGSGRLVCTPAPKLFARVDVAFEGYPPEHFEGGLDAYETAMHARTFGYVDELSDLQTRGLAQGVQISNVLGLSRDGTTQLEQRPKSVCELAQHKWLDLIGDLSLIGRPLNAKIEVSKGGHQLHHLLVKSLRHLSC